MALDYYYFFIKRAKYLLIFNKGDITVVWANIVLVELVQERILIVPLYARLEVCNDDCISIYYYLLLLFMKIV